MSTDARCPVAFAPFPYQKYDIEQVLKTPNIALWVDCGLGKTAITLTAIATLKLRLQVGKVLVIAPKRVAESTWQDEAAHWQHTSWLTFSTVLGDRKQRIAALDAQADIYVINRDNVMWLCDYYRNAWPFDMVVVDEASSFKNPKAKRVRALCTVLSHVGRVVELTGTPAPRNYLDIWAQIYLLDRGKRLGKTYTTFRDTYFKQDRPISPYVYTYKLRPGADRQIEQDVADIVISMKAKDYLQLPDMITDDIMVQLDAEAQIKHDQMAKDAVLELGDTVIDAGSAAVLRGKLLQIGNGAVYDANGTVAPLHDCKIERLIELLEALDGAPLLLFYLFKHDVPRIIDAVHKAMPDCNVQVFNGVESQTQWNAGKVQLLLAHPASCAYGLNLQQGGHHICWFGMNDSLELYQQANARLHRQGQSCPVIVHRLIIKGGMDEAVALGLEHKDKAQEELLEATKAYINKIKS